MKKEQLKVVTIGGGSSYTPELVEGFIKRYDTLPIDELWLVDIPEGEEKLNIVGALAKRMVEEAGLPMTVHLSLDRRSALQEADFVTTQFRVGQLDARAKDERIPLKYHVIGQETNGPGGLFKGLRTIPVLLEIINDMKELCPDAWLINFTNPAGMVTEAIYRHTDWRNVIGLCNVPVSMKMGVAEMFNVEAERVAIDFAGLNHMIYGLEVYLDGEVVTDEVIARLTSGDDSMTMRNIVDLGWEPSFLKGLGVLPCPYHRYYYQTSKMLEKELEEAAGGGTRAEVVQQVEADLFKKYEDLAVKTKPEELEQRGGAYYSDAACNLIESMYNDRGDIQPVNTMNNGAIASLEDGSAIEANCVITKNGPKPVAVGHLPVSVRGLVQQIKSFERVASEAAVTGDYETGLLAMTINPLVPSDDTAKQIFDEMLEAHREYLPQFA